MLLHHNEVASLFHQQIDSKYFFQVIVIHEREFFKYQSNNDNAEKWGTDPTSKLQEHKGFTQSLIL